MSMPSIGHNFPPEDLRTDLLDRHAALLKDATELLAAAEKAPKEINDDIMQGKVIDLIKKMRACELAIEKEWVAEEAPFKLNVGIVTGVFSRPFDDLEKLRKSVKSATTAYTARKEAAEKRRLEEEQERLRLEAADKLRKAQDAEQKKNDALRASSDFELLANQAKIARAAASSDIEAAEAKVLTAKATIGKAKADMLAAAAEFAARVRDGNPATEEEKAEKRTAFEKAKAEGQADLELAETELRVAKETASEALKKQREAEEQKREADRLAKISSRDEKAHLDDAVRDEKRADRIEAQADGPGLGQTRSEYGALSTNSRVWECRVVDVNKLDKIALWNLIDVDAIHIALRKWMLVQPQDRRVMAGAVMEEVAVGQVR